MAEVVMETPTLIGKEALSFLAKMKRNDFVKPSSKDKLLINIIKENEKLFSFGIQ
ncbi:MAG: hypothetical protein Q7K42_04295 [Candidatus Diapherotrites archaeon]|nr:hypothetical protein [Candidatus Diapherotrites archaeon]